MKILLYPFHFLVSFFSITYLLIFNRKSLWKLFSELEGRHD